MALIRDLDRKRIGCILVVSQQIHSLLLKLQQMVVRKLGRGRWELKHLKDMFNSQTHSTSRKQSFLSLSM